VPGDIADNNVEMVDTWVDETLISADRPYRLVVDLDRNASPIEAFWRKTLLYTLGEPKLFLHLLLARQEQGVGLAQLHFGAFQFADVRGGDNPKWLPVGGPNLPRGDSDWKATAVRSRDIEFVSFTTL
jgi:hypothetical protein